MNSIETEQKDSITSTETQSSKKKCCGIYGLQNKLKPDKWYIGQSFDIFSRFDKAYRRMHCKNQLKIYNALKKYGYDGFNKVVLEECIPKLTTLNERETYWIKFYDSIESGYNITEGGNRIAKSFTTSGWKHTPESIEKIRASKLGKIFGKRSKEVGIKIGNSLRGIKRSDATKQKNRMANIGKTLSKEHKEKIGRKVRERNQLKRQPPPIP